METTTPPQSKRSCIAQGLAALVGIVFVMVTVVILIALPTEAQLFNPDAYKRALASQDLYERLPSLLATMPMSSSDGSAIVNERTVPLIPDTTPNASSDDNDDNAARYLTPADLEVIAKEILSPEQTQSLMEAVIDQTLAYYNSTDSNAKIQVSMVDLKTRLGGENGDRIMRQVVASWPACTEAENQTWREVMASEQGEMPQCKPSDEILDQVTPELGKVLDEMVASIPDTADMTPKYLPDPEATGEDPRPMLMLVRWAIKLSPLLSILLLGIVTVLAVRSWKSFLGWWGALFLSVGVVTFLMAALSGLMVEGMIQSMVNSIVAQNEGGTDLFVVILEIIRHVLRGTGIQIGILAVLAGIMGLVMVVTAFVVGRSKARGSDPYSTQPA